MNSFLTKVITSEDLCAMSGKSYWPLTVFSGDSSLELNPPHKNKKFRAN